MNDTVFAPGAFKSTTLPLPFKDAAGNVIGRVVALEETEEGVQFEAVLDNDTTLKGRIT